jgi:hypothetical protein
VAPEVVVTVLLAQGDDPRALFLASQVGATYINAQLKRAAHMGYAPAQAAWNLSVPDNQAVMWAEYAESCAGR